MPPGLSSTGIPSSPCKARTTAHQHKHTPQSSWPKGKEESFTPTLGLLLGLSLAGLWVNLQRENDKAHSTTSSSSAGFQQEFRLKTKHGKHEQNKYVWTSSKAERDNKNIRRQRTRGLTFWERGIWSQPSGKSCPSFHSATPPLSVAPCFALCRASAMTVCAPVQIPTSTTLLNTSSRWFRVDLPVEETPLLVVL